MAGTLQAKVYGGYKHGGSSVAKMMGKYYGSVKRMGKYMLKTTSNESSMDTIEGGG